MDWLAHLLYTDVQYFFKKIKDNIARIARFIRINKITKSLASGHSCYRNAWKSTVYNVKTVSTDISGNIHRKCPIFFLTSIYQTEWLPKQFIIVRSPDHLVLIPGGFYYWRDACSTIYCRRKRMKEYSFNLSTHKDIVEDCIVKICLNDFNSVQTISKLSGWF